MRKLSTMSPLSPAAMVKRSTEREAMSNPRSSRLSGSSREGVAVRLKTVMSMAWGYLQPQLGVVAAAGRLQLQVVVLLGVLGEIPEDLLRGQGELQGVHAAKPQGDAGLLAEAGDQRGHGAV